SLVGSIGSLFGGGMFSSGPSNQEILDAVKQVSVDVRQLHHDMDARFDRVDQQLAELNRSLDEKFARLSAQMSEQQMRIDAILETTGSIERAVYRIEHRIGQLELNMLASQN